MNRIRLLNEQVYTVTSVGEHFIELDNYILLLKEYLSNDIKVGDKVVERYFETDTSLLDVEWKKVRK